MGKLRPCIVFIKERYKDQTIIGAEVGVFKGDNALDMLRNMPNIELLYLIDPYLKYQGFDDCAWAEQVEGMKDVARERLSLFKERVRWVYEKFEDCGRDEIRHPLDFIYIDGNHHYEYVKRDIELAVELVKAGGVIGGHDYSHPRWREVKEVVDAYCEKNGVTLHTGECDWWFIREATL